MKQGRHWREETWTMLEGGKKKEKVIELHINLK